MSSPKKKKSSRSNKSQDSRGSSRAGDRESLASFQSQGSSQPVSQQNEDPGTYDPRDFQSAGYDPREFQSAGYDPRDFQSIGSVGDLNLKGSGKSPTNNSSSINGFEDFQSIGNMSDLPPEVQAGMQSLALQQQDSSDCALSPGKKSNTSSRGSRQSRQSNEDDRRGFRSVGKKQQAAAPPISNRNIGKDQGGKTPEIPPPPDSNQPDSSIASSETNNITSGEQGQDNDFQPPSRRKFQGNDAETSPSSYFVGGNSAYGSTFGTGSSQFGSQFSIGGRSFTPPKQSAGIAAKSAMFENKSAFPSRGMSGGGASSIYSESGQLKEKRELSPGMANRLAMFDKQGAQGGGQSGGPGSGATTPRQPDRSKLEALKNRFGGGGSNSPRSENKNTGALSREQSQEKLPDSIKEEDENTRESDAVKGDSGAKSVAADLEAAKRRLSAEEKEKRRLSAEEKEQRRLSAEEKEQRRLSAEEKEKRRLSAEEKEQRRLSAEEKEKRRLSAEEKEQRRLSAEEKEQRRLSAEEKEQRRLSAEEKEKRRLSAEEKEQRRLSAEEKEKRRLSAEEKEQRRLSAEEKEQRRLSAEEKEQRRLSQEEKDRIAAEEEAERRRLSQEEKDRIAAEEESERRRLSQEEKDRIAAEEEAERRRLSQEEKNKAAQQKKSEVARDQTSIGTSVGDYSQDRANDPTSKFAELGPDGHAQLDELQKMIDQGDAVRETDGSGTYQIGYRNSTGVNESGQDMQSKVASLGPDHQHVEDLQKMLDQDHAPPMSKISEAQEGDSNMGSNIRQDDSESKPDRKVSTKSDAATRGRSREYEQQNLFTRAREKSIHSQTNVSIGKRSDRSSNSNQSRSPKRSTLKAQKSRTSVNNDNDSQPPTSPTNLVRMNPAFPSSSIIYSPSDQGKKSVTSIADSSTIIDPSGAEVPNSNGPNKTSQTLKSQQNDDTSDSSDSSSTDNSVIEKDKLDKNVTSAAAIASAEQQQSQQQMLSASVSGRPSSAHQGRKSQVSTKSLNQKTSTIASVDPSGNDGGTKHFTIDPNNLDSVSDSYVVNNDNDQRNSSTTTENDNEVSVYAKKPSSMIDNEAPKISIKPSTPANKKTSEKPQDEPVSSDSSASNATKSSQIPTVPGPKKSNTLTLPKSSTTTFNINTNGASATQRSSVVSQTNLNTILQENAAENANRSRIWRQRQKYTLQSDEDPEWLTHSNHIFVFTYSSKPVWTRYGSNEALGQFCGVLQVIASKMAKFFSQHSSYPGNPGSKKPKEDEIRSLTTGSRKFVFLEKGPLILVAISKHKESLPEKALRLLLERIHIQFLVIVTEGVERELLRKPNLDVRSYVGGTEHVFSNMSRWCFRSMHLVIEDGYEVLPLSPAYRSVCTEALRGLARIDNIFMGLIFAGERVVSMVSSKKMASPTYQGGIADGSLGGGGKSSLDGSTNSAKSKSGSSDNKDGGGANGGGTGLFELPELISDLTPVINYVLSSDSLKKNESWTPICLPSVSSEVFCYAYIKYMPVLAAGNQNFGNNQQQNGPNGTSGSNANGICLMFFSFDNSGDQFLNISKASRKIETQLRDTRALSAIQESMDACPILISYNLQANYNNMTLSNNANTITGKAAQAQAQQAAANQNQNQDGTNSILNNTANPGPLPLNPNGGPSYLSTSFRGQLAFLLDGVIHGSYYDVKRQQIFSSGVKINSENLIGLEHNMNNQLGLNSDGTEGIAKGLIPDLIDDDGNPIEAEDCDLLQNSMIIENNNILFEELGLDDDSQQKEGNPIYSVNVDETKGDNNNYTRSSQNSSATGTGQGSDGRPSSTSIDGNNTNNVTNSNSYFLKHFDHKYQKIAYEKYVFRNYAKCREILENCKRPSQICIATASECFYCWLMPDFHLYLCVPRGISTSVIGQYYQWLKSQREYLFLTPATW